MNFEQYTLDARAVEYIRRCLGKGNTLAREILAKTDLSGGDLTTLLPANVDKEKIYDFRSGGKIPMADESQWVRRPGMLAIPLTDISIYPAAVVAQFLKEDPYHFCICEDSLAEPTDLWITKSTLRIYTFNKEVYAILLPTDNRRSKILETIRSGRTSQLFIAAMTSMSQNDLILQDSRGMFSQVQLSYFAHHIQALVIGAYDGEGYLIWKRRSSL
jgi:hypothetical protein